MKTLKKLTLEDSIAFWDNKYGIIVTTPSVIYTSGKIIVHCLYEGYKSTSQTLNPGDVLAIRNREGEGTIEGLRGSYDILQPEKLKEYLAKK